MNRYSMFRSLAVLVAGLVISACSSDGKPKPHETGGNVGSVGLAIKLADNAEVDLVRYSITRPESSAIEGNIPVGDPGATVSALIDLAAATGYTIELAAVSMDLGTVCLGEAQFDVVAGQTTAVSVVMDCHTDSASGSVEVVATLNTCPQVANLVVAPLAVKVGHKINVLATGADPDASDTLTFAWNTSGGGTFEAANAAHTKFTCVESGRHTLSVAVSDGKCTRSRDVAVTCAP
jgi:hypothetical protein